MVYIEQLTSALYLERRSDVDHYMEIMNRLSAEALTPALTTKMQRATTSNAIARPTRPTR